MPALCDVTHYKAKGDGIAKDTGSIQSAIDEAGTTGGVVYFPSGTYQSGTLHLRSNATIELSANATLIASPDERDFDTREEHDYDSQADDETSCFRHSLLYGENLQNVAIVGRGTIDARGTKRGGPKPIALRNCSRISIQDVTLSRAPNYNLSFLGCEHVNIQGVKILNGFVDGIDLDCCHHVTIANCYIESQNDALCAKASMALGYPHSTENITITNCILTTTRNGFKLGSESVGDFKNIVLSNCVILHQPAIFEEPPASGIALLAVDGGGMERIVVSNVVMAGVRVPIFIRLGNRKRGKERREAGILQDVAISNIVATGAELAVLIAGIPGKPVRRVALTDLQVLLLGGGQTADVHREIGEEITTDPRVSMFGILPSHGLFCRHVENLTLNRVELRLSSADGRPTLIAESITGLDLICFRPPRNVGTESTVWFKNVRDGLLEGARAVSGTGTFLRLSGAATENIRALANDLSEAEVAFQIDDDVREGALLQGSNLLSRGE